jgi:hypothetical protein
MAATAIETRMALVRRGQVLSRLTLAYNSLEAVASIIAGMLAGSISLVGFGIDSVIEVSSSVAALWRLRADIDERSHGPSHSSRAASSTTAMRAVT